MDSLYKRGLHLSYFTVAYNMLEAIASILFGGIASSIALIGFGLDSIVESLSGLVMVWRFRQHGNLSEADEERVEKRAMRFVGITFFVLAAYVFVESARKLIFREIPDPSLPGIIIAVLSLIIMPLLAHAKIRLGERIGSRALIADAKETLACTFLSLALLVGLGANYLVGFWQADPLVGLIVVVFLVREGREVQEEAAGRGHEDSTDGQR